MVLPANVIEDIRYKIGSLDICKITDDNKIDACGFQKPKDFSDLKSEIGKECTDCINAIERLEQAYFKARDYISNNHGSLVDGYIIRGNDNHLDALVDEYKSIQEQLEKAFADYEDLN